MLHGQIRHQSYKGRSLPHGSSPRYAETNEHHGTLRIMLPDQYYAQPAEPNIECQNVDCVLHTKYKTTISRPLH